jgi:arylsulfatase A-like enzyme
MEPDLMLEEIRRYYTMIANTDRLFGELRAAAEAKRMWDQSVVLFTADHGDMMGAHRMRLKGTLPYEEIFRIPFILKLPSDARPPVRKVVDDLGVNVSQPGTLLDAAGLQVPATFKGGSLLSRVYHERRPQTEAVFYEHYSAYWGVHPFRAIRARDADGAEWKLVRYYGSDAGEDELYDLAGDPLELHNRAADASVAEVRRRLEQQVDEWWAATEGRDAAYYESQEFKDRGRETLFDERRDLPRSKAATGD